MSGMRDQDRRPALTVEAIRNRWIRRLSEGAPTRSIAQVILWASGAAVVLFPFSLVFIAGGLLPPSFGWTATVSIFLYAAVVAASELRFSSLRSVAGTAMLIGVIFFAIEWIGVNTGLPFGRYVYTDVLTPLVAGVPVAIAAAWYSTLVSTWRIGSWLAGGGRGARLRTALYAGVLTLALDLALEPFASFVNGYWLWVDGTVPLQNTISWFVLATAGAWILAGRTPVNEARRLLHLPAALLVYSLQVVLFSVTGLASGHLAGAGAALLIAGACLAMGTRRDTLQSRRRSAAS
jgi:putative membrane protein